MRDIRRMLTPEEREEYDSLFFDALHDESGVRVPSSDVGNRAQDLLRDAEQAGREWAEWVMADAMIDGLRSRAIKWANTKDVVTTAIGIRTVTKAAARGIRRKSEDGKSYHQQMFWQDMTAAQLQQVARDAGARRAADGDNIAIARRLLDLIERTGIEPVSEALESIGMTLEEFLGEENVA